MVCRGGEIRRRQARTYSTTQSSSIFPTGEKSGIPDLAIPLFFLLSSLIFLVLVSFLFD
jgi:hypothetical protein